MQTTNINTFFYNIFGETTGATEWKKRKPSFKPSESTLMVWSLVSSSHDYVTISISEIFSYGYTGKAMNMHINTFKFGKKECLNITFEDESTIKSNIYGLCLKNLGEPVYRR